MSRFQSIDWFVILKKLMETYSKRDFLRRKKLFVLFSVKSRRQRATELCQRPEAIILPPSSFETHPGIEHYSNAKPVLKTSHMHGKYL